MGPSSTRLFSLLMVAGAAALAACGSDNTATAPSTSPARSAAAALASAPAQGSSAGQYIILFRGNGVPAGFATKVADLGGRVVYANDGAGFAFVAGASDSAAAQLGALSGVAEIQADESLTLDAPRAAAEETLTDAGTSQTNPATAARYVWQWNMRLIGANTAWAAGKLGSSSVTAAILDTGIDYDAPDLNGLVDLSRSASFIPSDDQITATYFPTRHPISDYHGHGTNVATQVSSKAVALAGVTSRTTLIGVKVLGANGSGSFGAVLSGVLWAADHGANVANMSLGGAFAKAGNGRFVATISRVFGHAKQQGMLVVVAAGNETEDLDHNGNEFKTYCDAVHVVCVSAIGPALATSDPDAPTYYTNFGRSAITVAAPGGNADAANGFPASLWPWGNDIASWVWSFCSKTRIAGFNPNGSPILTVCAAGNRLSGFIGTSQATPHVAGLAAILAAEGIRNPAQLKQAIVKSANDLGQVGTDPYFGRGRINVARALGL